MRVVIVAVTSLALVTGSLEAQVDEVGSVRRVDLTEALTLFAEHNLELRMARAEADAVTGRIRQLGAWPNPSLAVTHEDLSGAGGSYSETYLNLSQAVQWPWRRAARSRAGAAARASAQSDVTADSSRLAFEMKRAFVEGVAAELERDVTRQVSEVFSATVDRGRARFAAGDVSGYEVRRLRLEHLRYESLMTEAEMNVEVTRRRLTALLAADDGATTLAPAGFPSFESRSIPPVEDLIALAQSRRPEISAAVQARAAAEAEVSAQRAGRLPEPTLTGGYKRQSDAFDGVLLGIAWPMPVFNRRGGAVAVAAANVVRTDALERITRRQVEAETRTARLALDLADRRLARLGEFADDSANLLAIALASYREGEMTLLELLDAARAHRDAVTAVADLRAAYWTAYFDLERAVGGLRVSP